MNMIVACILNFNELQEIGNAEFHPSVCLLKLLCPFTPIVA